jgi:hypothetical protein
MHENEPRIVAPHALDETAAATYTGLSVSYLRASRLENPRTEGPPFVKAGRAVRYLVSDLDAWLTSRRITRNGPEAA